MKISTITAGHSRKEGRPNYGSEDYHFSLTIEVEPGEDLTELAKSMFETCKAKVNEQFAAAKGSYEFPSQNAIKSVSVSVNEKLKEINVQPFDWKKTPGGEKWLERKGEIDDNFGEENGPRGSSFNDERVESTSGQQ